MRLWFWSRSSIGKIRCHCKPFRKFSGALILSAAKNDEFILCPQPRRLHLNGSPARFLFTHNTQATDFIFHEMLRLAATLITSLGQVLSKRVWFGGLTLLVLTSPLFPVNGKSLFLKSKKTCDFLFTSPAKSHIWCENLSLNPIYCAFARHQRNGFWLR